MYHSAMQTVAVISSGGGNVCEKTTRGDVMRFGIKMSTSFNRKMMLQTDKLGGIESVV